MKEINENDFLKLLSAENKSEHTDLIIDFKNATKIDLSNVTLLNKFSNCRFQGNRIDFLNQNLSEKSDLSHSFRFDNCEMQNEVYFKDCSLGEISFSNASKPIKSLHLAPNKLDYFRIEGAENDNQEIKEFINITIHNCEKINYIDFLRLKSTGSLLISGCNIKGVKIHNCVFQRIDIDDCTFDNEFQFTLNKIDVSYINHNEFNKTNFSHTDFGIDANFSFNDFTGTSLFENLKNENRTRIKFISCNFMEYTYFNKSILYELYIDTSKFLEFTSFQDLKLNSIFLDRTIFEKLAFFDDIEIQSFIKCNKRSLRNIKQQLLRADNKIDYDNFRSHELNSYKEELKKKIKQHQNTNSKKLRRDLTILRINSFYSNNGTDWVKAIKRTLFIAFFFYSIFYGIYNSGRAIDLSNTHGYNEFFVGLFRYLLLTDFHNPLTDEREYLSSVWEWIPFVLGKIFVGIGIYEVLVSFRKFKK